MHRSVFIIFLLLALIGSLIFPTAIQAAVNPATPVEAMIEAGDMYTVMLKSDGIVWAWGLNDCGQLGDGTTVNKATPVQVKGLKDIIAISAGKSHAVALKRDGTVWTWGSNTFGELGDGTSKSRSVPAAVKGISDAVAISASMDHTTAVVLKDGTVRTWGRNESGQLGDGTKSLKRRPVKVKNLTSVIAVSAGGSHTVALKKDGTVWSWGGNTFGQLGNGSDSGSLKPVQAKNLNNVIDISAGSCYTTALKKDGTLWGWGVNYDGRLGLGYKEVDYGAFVATAPDTSTRYSPVQIKAVSGVAAISSRYNHTVIVKKDGTVWATGNNYYGQVGDGSRGFNEYEPVKVEGLSDIVDVSAGCKHTVAVAKDGSVWAWGYNRFGAFGNGIQASLVPVKVEGLSDVGYITEEERYIIAFKNDGTAWAWGDGYGTVPVKVDSLSDAISIVDNNGLFVLKKDGTVWSRKGEIKKEEIDRKTFNTAEFAPIDGLSNVISISSIKAGTVIALKKDGSLWTCKNDTNWGEWYTTPVQQYKELTGVKYLFSRIIEPNGYVKAAIKNDGSVWVQSDISISPISKVENFTGAIAVCAGRGQYVALKKDETVWTWTVDTSPYKNQEKIPVMVKDLTGVVSVSAGISHIVVAKKDGTVWAWGNNDFGQLGNGTLTSSATPVQVKGISNAVAVYSYGNYSAVLTKDGSVYAWGDNYFGHHGNDTESAVCKPVSTGLTCK
jgi:alpha-tubulin suppressor-like RCC1 family protein